MAQKKISVLTSVIRNTAAIGAYVSLWSAVQLSAMTLTTANENWGEQLRRLWYRSVEDLKLPPDDSGFPGYRPTFRRVAAVTTAAGVAMTGSTIERWFNDPGPPPIRSTRQRMWAAIVAMGGDPHEFGLSDADALVEDVGRLRRQLSPYRGF